MGTDTVILTLVGIGIIVLLGMLLIKVSARPAAPEREVIVEHRPWGWPGYGPYYSHLPLRPLVY